MQHSDNEWPASAQGIELAIDYYRKLGWTVRAFVPRYFLGSKGRRRADNPELLEKLQKEGCVFTIPSQDHDDNYWIAYALQTGAYVVTNDRMKDHSDKHPEGEESFFRWRDAKVISYTFVENIFLPNPEFKLSKAPPKEEKIVKVQSPKKEKTKPVKNTRSKKPTQNELKRKVVSIVKSRLSSGPLHLQTLSQHLLKKIKRKDGSVYTSIKDIMRDLGLPRSRPFYYQLEKLMGDEIEIINRKGAPHSAKLKSRTKPKQREPQKKPGKRMTMSLFKQALGESNAELLGVPKNEFPEIIEKSFDMLCSLELPINVAEVGNRFKGKTGTRLAVVFNKMDKLAFFLSIRPECKCDHVVVENLEFQCRKKSPKTAGSSLLSRLWKWFRPK